MPHDDRPPVPPTRDMSEPYDMQLSKDEATVLRLAMHNAGLDHDAHMQGQVVTLTDDNVPAIVEAVAMEITTSMARAHDEKRETGDYDTGEVDVIEIGQDLTKRVIFEYKYGEHWREYVDDSGGTDT